MKRTGILALCLFFVYPAAAQIPLEQAVKEGIRKNLSVRNQLLAVESQEESLHTAELGKRFTVDSGASYRYQSQRMNIEIRDLSLTAGTHHTYDFNLRAQQILFNGNILNKVVEAESIQIAVEKNAVALKKVEIAAEIKGAYFTYRLLKNKRYTLETLAKRLDLHLEQLEILFTEELVRKSDVLETKNRMSELRLQMEELDALMEAERTRFRFLSGVELADVDDNYFESELTFDQAAALFSSGHPVILTLNDNLRLLGVREDMIKGRRLPRIAAFTEAHFGKPGIDFFQNEWSLYFIGGIQISMPVFNWNRESGDLRILDINRRKLVNEKTDFIEKGENRLRLLFDQLESIDRKIRIIENLVRTSREENELKEDLQREQQISNLEYLASLTAGEQYLSRMNEMRVEREIIKLGINSLIGSIEEE
ncbi:MAG: TolC family protein [Pseudomonadota bacterium]